jgi:hypothetical protein
MILKVNLPNIITIGLMGGLDWALLVGSPLRPLAHSAPPSPPLLLTVRVDATCGGHVMTSLPAVGLIDVFSATIPDFPFRPQLHVNYAETVLPMRDGLPKLRDFPAEMGGSRDIISE